MVFSRRFYQSPAEVIDDRGFRAEVAAVDDDDALLKGFLSVVVFHIAGQIEVSPGLFRQINETGPTAAEEGNAANGHIRIAGIGQGVAMEDVLDLSKNGCSRFRCRPISDAAHGEGMDGIFQGIDVISRFFIGMSLDHSRQDLIEQAFRNDGLDPFFSYCFDLADAADKGIRPFMGLEPPFSLDGKGTVTVISDIAGTAVSQGLTQGVTVAFRDVDGDL